MPFYENFRIEIAPYLDDYEIIMVNDASPDNSWEVMQTLADMDPKVRLIKLTRNFGAMTAVYTGFRYATGDCVAIKAADLQEPASVTVQLYQKWKEGAKVVLAVRQTRKDPFLSKIFSGLYYKLMQKFVVKDMPDGGFDIYLLDREVARKLIGMREKNSPIPLQILWLGYEPVKVYYDRQKREIGKSSWTFSKKLKMFVDSFVGFSYIPIRFMSMVGLLFFVLSIIWGIFICIARILGKIPVQGYTAIMVLILFSSGLIMFVLGILGEYIWRTLDEVRNRPISVVERVINFNDERIEDGAN
jgi:dolichol-phosphate mannosyltransferase